MQPIEPPHQFQIGRQHWTRQVVNTAATDTQNRCLPGDRQVVLTVDHRFALSNPASVSAPSKRTNCLAYTR